MTDMRKPFDHSGFTPPAGRHLGHERRSVALAELIASAALALCTLVVATVLTAGMARADVIDGVIGHEESLFGVAFLLGLLFIGMSGLSLLPGGRPKKR
jgi:hypothetical protein